MRKVFLISVLMISAACNRDSSTSDKPNSGASCPLVAVIPFHQVNFIPKVPLPTKIAINIDGALKYDECLEEATIPPAPIVTTKRSDGKLEILVQHFDAYPELPKEFSFEIFDQGSCSGANLSYFKAQHIPLDFKKVYPYGKECGGNTSAEVDIIQE